MGKISKNKLAVAVNDHPVLKHYLTILRDKKTQPDRFRRVLGEISRFLAYEAIRDIKTTVTPTKTPVGLSKTSEQIAQKIIAVAILRAGEGMLPSVLEALPFAEGGHIGIYRDKFIENTVEYFFRLPDDTKDKLILVLDPLLATGETACAAVSRLKDYGVKKIRFLCVIAAPQGIKALKTAHPDVDIHCLSIEEGLNSKGYILPGLGDAGDRIYGTV